jgi:hypothetical protein
MDIQTEIITTTIAVAGPILALLIKLMWDNSQRTKNERKRDERDAKMRSLRIEADSLKIRRERDYDAYDRASKALVLAHAISYLNDNDRNKLKDAIDDMEDAKEGFKETNRNYYDHIEQLTEQMREA